jgi:hypothetical protein
MLQKSENLQNILWFQYIDNKYFKLCLFNVNFGFKI